MKRLILGLIGMLTAGLGSAAKADMPYIGEIRTFAFNFCPSGWAPLNGQLLPIAEYNELFNLLGTRYGGDGNTTFAMPVGQPIYAANGEPFLQCISLFGAYPPAN
jgi:hypothetical protein